MALSLIEPGLLPGLAVFAILAILGCLSLVTTRAHHETLRFQIRLFLIAFALRFALSVVIYQFGLVNVLGDEDSSGWIGGAGLAKRWTDQQITLAELPYVVLGMFDGRNSGYQFSLATLFFLTDSPFRLAAAAMNGFFGAMTVIFAYRIARSLFSEWVAARVGWWTCLFPSMLIWSAMTVKEPIVIFLETVALYGCIRVRQAGISVPHLLLCAVSTVLLTSFRFYAAYLIGAAILLSLVDPTFFRPKSTLSGLALGAVVIGLISATGLLARHEAEFQKFNLDRVQDIRSNLATGQGSGSGVKTEDVRTPGGFVSGLVIGAAHLLAAPFPWQMGSGLRVALTAPELVYWWWLIWVGFIPGVVYSIRKRLADVRALLLLLLGFGMLYSLTFGNVGLVFRQRAQLLPWMFVIAAAGLEQRTLRKLAQKQALEAAWLERQARRQTLGLVRRPRVSAAEEGGSHA